MERRIGAPRHRDRRVIGREAELFIEPVRGLACRAPTSAARARACRTQTCTSTRPKPKPRTAGWTAIPRSRHAGRAGSSSRTSSQRRNGDDARRVAYADVQRRRCKVAGQRARIQIAIQQDHRAQRCVCAASIGAMVNSVSPDVINVPRVIRFSRALLGGLAPRHVSEIRDDLVGSRSLSWSGGNAGICGPASRAPTPGCGYSGAAQPAGSSRPGSSACSGRGRHGCCPRRRGGGTRGIA